MRNRIDEIRERLIGRRESWDEFLAHTGSDIEFLLAEVARLDEANKIKFDLIMTVHAPKIANLEAKLAKRDKKLDRAVDALNAIAHIGVVMDEETGQEWQCHPIDVARKTLRDLGESD